MNDGSRTEATVTHDRTRSGSSSWPPSTVDMRVPGLTVLYHPDLDRVGERTVLGELGTDRGVGVARLTPEFAAPGGEVRRPLGDKRISRRPILLRRRGGGLHIDRGESSTRLEVEGRAVAGAVTFPDESLEQGLVMLLGGSVVLLWHLLDPVVDTPGSRFGLVGESPAMVRLRRDIVQTADLGVTILLRGESGTGKELVARAIHDAGPRRDRPWVAVNMAAVPANLAAAELFGAERGAYTGADRRRAGYFERARGGSLFLDEIGETPPEVQALLLRALETGEVQAVGSEHTKRPDVRVISATDANLEAAIDAERFRSPLLHRLSGYVIRLPPLRERREDFGRLFVTFLRRELSALDLQDRLGGRWLPASLVARLALWHWPGNVRQLANTVRQLVIANRDADPARHFDDIEALLGVLAERIPDPVSNPDPVSTPDPVSNPGPVSTEDPVRSGPRRPSDLREGEIVAALRAHRFRPAAAADALGIPRSSIYDLIAKIPGLRKASDLTREEITAALDGAGPSLEAVAAALEVSERALRRRMGELGMTRPRGT